jgi:hypothetical protein
MLEKTANILWNNNENFDFRIFDSLQELEGAIKEKVKEG